MQRQNTHQEFLDKYTCETFELLIKAFMVNDPMVVAHISMVVPQFNYPTTWGKDHGRDGGGGCTCTTAGHLSC